MNIENIVKSIKKIRKMKIFEFEILKGDKESLTHVKLDGSDEIMHCGQGCLAKNKKEAKEKLRKFCLENNCAAKLSKGSKIVSCMV